MTPPNGDLMVWGHGLCALVYALLALHLVRQSGSWRGRGMANGAVFAAVLFTALWGVASALSDGSAPAPVWWWLAAVLDVLRYTAWFAFILALLGQGQWGSAPGRGMRVLGLSLAALALLALGLSGGWQPQATPGLGRLFLAMMSLAVLGLVLVEQLWRNLPEDSLWSAKPVCLGLAGTFFFDLYLFSQGALFKGLDPDAWAIRGPVHALMMPLLLLSATRHRNWIAKIRVSRQVVFHSATLFLAGLYLLFIAAVGYYVRFFGGDWGGALQLGLVFAAVVTLVVLAVSRSFRASVRVWLDKHFFRYRFDYRQEWLRFTQTLSNQAVPGELGLNVIRGLADFLESPAGALWLRRPGEDGYQQISRWNLPAHLEREPADSAWVAFMRSTGWVVNLQEYRASPGRYRGLKLPAWLAHYPQAWLFVPLWLGDELLGFVMLASPRTAVDVNWEVNDLLKTAGRQAASYLGQMQATEALLESRKFEAFSKMSAFVVHDLKNIVTQLSLMVKNAKRLHANPEFQADMLLTVEHSLDRMRQLMLQLREGAAPAGSPVGVDLADIAHRCQASAQGRGRQLRLELDGAVLTRGQPERLERVVGHVVQNALDATESAGEVWLRLDRYGSHARLEIGDNGTGMSEDFIQHRLFRPFQTTKKHGMGIGAYESFQYVQELGGKVEVRSQLGQGTTITLLLPLIETFQESDLHQLGEP